MQFILGLFTNEVEMWKRIKEKKICLVRKRHDQIYRTPELAINCAIYVPCAHTFNIIYLVFARLLI